MFRGMHRLDPTELDFVERSPFRLENEILVFAPAERVFDVLTSERSGEFSLNAEQRAARTVFLPLSLPGLAAGTLIVFILCLGFYVTPAVLGGGKVIMVSNHIANDIELFFNWGAASALGVVLLVLTLALLWLATRITRLDRLFGESTA